MNALAILQELQAAHDGLRVIQRDLSALPPDMARLDVSLKTAGKRLQEIEKAILAAKDQSEALEKQRQQAIKAEDRARRDLKASTHKVQYTAAMRSLEDKERQIETFQRALKESAAALSSLEAERQSLILSQDEYQRQFDELQEIFLAEHENQVVGKDRLTKLIVELEGKLDAAALNKFNRLMQNRNGRAVVPLENDVCTGCNTKLRMPLIYKLRAEGAITCEYCQRIIFLPS